MNRSVVRHSYLNVYRLSLSIRLLILASAVSFVWCDEPIVIADEQQPSSVVERDSDEQKIEKNDPQPNSKPAVGKKPKRIQKFLKGLFAPGGLRFEIPSPHDEQNSESTELESSTSTERDYIDERAPHDAKVEQQLKRAELAFRTKDWKTFGEQVQRILDLPEDSLYRRTDGRYESVRKSTNRLLGTAPTDVLSAYRVQNAGLAQNLLTAAHRSGKSHDYVLVANRFFHTPAGYEAANYLGMLHLDRAEFALAADWFDQLLRASAPVTRTKTWKAKAVLAFHQAGRSKSRDANSSISPSLETTDEVETGIGRVRLAEWLDQFSKLFTRSSDFLDEWTQLGGSTSRTGRATGGEPLLKPIWSQPLTANPNLAQRIVGILQDLADQNTVPILTTVPIVVDGKVIYRNLRSLCAVDIDSGMTAWEGVEGNSPERILTGSSSQQIEPIESDRNGINQQPFNIEEIRGQGSEAHPLSNLLFREGTYNVLSSDGLQVFVIEDHGVLSRVPPGQSWGWDGATDNSEQNGLPWKTNRLVSYDIRTGSRLWSVGGTDSREGFRLPLAGSYFFGVPTVDGDELFIVAGQGDEIRLWSLDRVTGVPRWSQLIAYSDTRIEQDIGRRWYTALVSSSGGILYCPTTVGWLIAVDRLTQTVLWTYRYSPVNQDEDRDSESHFVPAEVLDSQWPPSAPIVSGNVVVMTPPEEPLVVALNAMDGNKLWEIEKEEWSYVAGVVNDLVVMVGRAETAALELQSGEVRWRTAHGNAGVPSGRGVFVGDHFYLPHHDGALHMLDVSTGRLISEAFIPSGTPALGNLAMHRGRLVSISPQAVLGFGQRDSVERDIETRLANNPQDVKSLLERSEIAILDRRFDVALENLRSLSVGSFSPVEEIRFHKAMIAALSAVIRSNPAGHEKELAELADHVMSTEEQLVLLELTSDRLVSQHRFADAFDILWAWVERNKQSFEDPFQPQRSQRFASDGSSSSLIPSASSQPSSIHTAFIQRADDRLVWVSRSRWISGRLLDVWDAASDSDRQKIEARIRSIIELVSKEARPVRAMTSRILSFHPSTFSLREKLVEEMAAKGNFAIAELELLDMAGISLPEHASRSLDRHARLMEQFQKPEDAKFLRQQMVARYGDVKLSNGKTVSEVIQEELARTLQSKVTSRSLHWNVQPLRMRQGTAQHVAPPQEISVPAIFPSMESTSVEIQPQDHRLTFENLNDNSLAWWCSLRNHSSRQEESFVVSEWLGHQAVVVHRGILHLISPIEKKQVWSRSLDQVGDGGSGWADDSDGDSDNEGFGAGNPFWRHASRQPLLPMMSVSRDSDSSMSLMQEAQNGGRMAVVHPNYVCVYGRRSITLLDPLTGTEIWSRSSLPLYSIVLGTQETLFIVPQDEEEVSEKVLAFRVLDGKPQDAEGSYALLSNTLLTRGNSLIVAEPGSGTASNLFRRFRTNRVKLNLKSVHPIRKNEIRWQFEYPPGSLVSPLDREELLVSLPDGKVERVDAATGRRTSLASIPSGVVNSSRAEAYALSDHRHIFVVMNSHEHSHQRHFGESLQSIQALGKIFAWNKSDGTLAWQSEVEHHNLILDQFRTSPVLLFVSRSWKQKGSMNYATLSLKVIDKETGKTLHQSTTPSIYSGFNSVRVSYANPSIELASYNLKIRLSPYDGPLPEPTLDQGSEEE